MGDFLTDFKKYINKDLPPEQAERLKKIEQGQKSFRQYCNLINPEFFKPERAYQDTLCNTLQQAYEKKLINPETNKPYDIIIIALPPGFGKTYTKMLFNTWVYGKNRFNKAVDISYNQTLSLESARGTRDLIQDEEMYDDNNYYCVNSFFPKVKIRHGDAAVERWRLEGRGVYRSYLATSFDGSITGLRGNLIFIDDPVKNHVEAVNEKVKEGHWAFFRGTLPSRVLPGGLQVIIQTRWATDDLAGRIISDPEYGPRCYVLEMKALSEDSENGISLCENLYPTEDLQAKRRGMIPEIWSANFMQTPIDIQGALYGGFKTYDAVDFDRFERIINYTDTADEGADYLASGSAGIIDGYIYVTDVYYTDESMEITESELARRLNLNKVKECVIESNNGGRGFARNVITRLKAIRNKACNVTWFHQSKNKRTRILVNASNVCEKMIMPAGWEKKWPTFYKALMSYQRKGKNDHDDGPDMLTGLYEFAINEVKGRKKAKVLKRSLFGI